MKDVSSGNLINHSGYSKYINPDAPEKLIKYITRTNGKLTDDLVSWGGLGVAEFLGVKAIINQFYLAQAIHTRKGKFGRYIDHDVFSFTSETETLINENMIDIDKIARKMAYDIYERDNCQVVYGVHRPSGTDKHMHIHFAINTVNYATGNKRHENIRQTKERENRFQKIVDAEIESVKVH